LCSVFMNAIIYKCSEAGLENSVVRDTTFCLAIYILLVDFFTKTCLFFC